MFLSFSLLKLSLLGLSLSVEFLFLIVVGTKVLSPLSRTHTKKKKSVFSISAVLVSHTRRDKEQRRERRKKEYDFKHVKRAHAECLFLTRI